LDNCSAVNDSDERRDNILGKVYAQIMHIESRLLPCSLYSDDVPPNVDEVVATFINIHSLIVLKMVSTVFLTCLLHLLIVKSMKSLEVVITACNIILIFFL